MQRNFLFLFVVFFVLGFDFAKVVPQIMKLFPARYLAYGNKEDGTVSWGERLDMWEDLLFRQGVLLG